MKPARFALSVAVATLLPAFLVDGVTAQPGNCLDCLIGLYDDPGRLSSMGTSTAGQVKSIYLGIEYAPGESGLNMIEFSVAGMRFDVDGVLVTTVEWMPQPVIVLGPGVASPADTTASSTGNGGLVVAWSPVCLVFDRTLARIDLLHFAPIVDHVFQVKRRYPPVNPMVRTPAFGRCDTNFTTVRASGGCYILNWSGDPNVIACLDGPVAVEQHTWTGMKSLFR